MTMITPLNFEATTDLVHLMYVHGAPIGRERVGSMEVVSGLIENDQEVSQVIDGVTGESVRVQ